MLKFKFLFILFSVLSVSGWAQSFSLSGVVVDSSQGNPIPLAKLLISDSNGVETAFETDFDGNFKFRELKPGIYTITVNVVGYYTTTFRHLSVQTDAFVRFPLIPVELGETPNIKWGVICLMDSSGGMQCIKVEAQ